MKSIIALLNSKEPPTRWWAVVCAISAIVISSFISLYLQNTSRVDGYRVQQIEVMFDSMVQFQTFASAFAAEMNEEGTVTTNTRNKLLENLNDQFGRIRIIQQSIPEINSATLENYHQKVLHMINVVNDTDDIASMREFWSAASDLLYARNELNQQLKTAI